MNFRLFMVGAALFVIFPVSSQAQCVVKEFNAPGPESRGLAWDGQYLWCVDAQKDSLFKIDPASGQVVRIIHFDFNPSNGGAPPGTA